MKNKIIIPIDFEKQSIIAIDYAKYFASLTNAELVLVHIIEESKIFRKLFKDDFKKVEIEAKKQLNQLASQIEDTYKVRTIIKHGKPYEEIEDIIEDEEPLFTLIGKTEKPTLKKRLLGSNTLHLVNESDFPVISIAGDYILSKKQQNSKTIILPVDTMKCYDEQVTAAIEFAKILKSAIKVITIDNLKSIAHRTEQLTSINQIGKTIEKAGVKCSTKILEDDKESVPNIINKYALDNDAHLIIIMTHDEDNFKDVFLGSNARNIIQISLIPVLSVAPWDRDDDNPIFSFIYGS